MNINDHMTMHLAEQLMIEAHLDFICDSFVKIAGEIPELEKFTHKEIVREIAKRTEPLELLSIKYGENNDLKTEFENLINFVGVLSRILKLYPIFSSISYGIHHVTNRHGIILGLQLPPYLIKGYDYFLYSLLQKTGIFFTHFSVLIEKHEESDDKQERKENEELH